MTKYQADAVKQLDGRKLRSVIFECKTPATAGDIMDAARNQLCRDGVRGVQWLDIVRIKKINQ